VGQRSHGRTVCHDRTELFHFYMFRLNEHEGGYYIKIHHLLSDAWTFIQLGDQIMRYYHALLRGRPILPERVPSYLDYVGSEQEYFASDRFTRDKAYWNNRFADLPDFTTLKTHGVGTQGLKSRRKTFVLPRKLSLKIQEHCLEYKTSPFTLFLASLAIYINRVTGKDDLIIGTPVLNRVNHREKETIGMFISTVPIRVALTDGEQDFRAFYGTISRSGWRSFDTRNILMTCCSVTCGTPQGHRIPLRYRALLPERRFEQNEDDEIEHEGRWHFNGYQTPSLSIHLNDRESLGDLVIDYDYRENLYYAKEIEFIHDHIIRILWHALDNPARAVSRIDMISEKEIRRLLYEYNETDADYPREATLHSLFEEQAARWPERTAVTCRSRSLNYRQLDRWANRLAWDLRSRGVGPDRIVALFLHRSIAMIPAILGVLKAGGAYLPIDPDYPEDRIRYLLEDSGATLMVTDQPDTAVFDGIKVDIAAFEAPDEASGDRDGTCPPPPSAGPSHLAYIIYTSGSTGRPKGVMIEHRNVVRLMVNSRFQFEIDHRDVWSMFHSYCFDFSVWEMYGALLYGGRLVIIPRDAARDTRRCLRILEHERVTMLSQTPAAFYNLVHEDMQQLVSRLSLRYVVFGGEALKPLLLQPFFTRHPDTRLINMYGITETTVHVTFKEIGEEEIEKNVSNIGRPIPTLHTYICDKNLMLLPIGVPGELCVGGDGVGRGYLNNPELTAQRFVPNPYVPGETLYRSGDLVRMYARGEMEYLGRIDNQVKIRGHRIELGEIESTLLRHPSISAAVVLTRENQLGIRQLCAYYVPAGGTAPADIREYLSTCLPEYMIPSYLVPLEHLPLTANGKVDRKNLPAPEENAEVEVAYVSPENEIQAEIVSVWSDILEIDRDKIGIDNDFFALGGDSLNAIRVVARLDSGLTVTDLYDMPTVRQLEPRLVQLREAEQTGTLLSVLGPVPDGTAQPPTAPNATGIAAATIEAAVATRPSASDVTRVVVEPEHEPAATAPVAAKAPSDLLRRLAGPRGAAARILVCFPYGGGTAINYKALATAVRALSPDTAVYGVAPQGHEFGRTEPFQTIQETAKRVVDEILRKVRGPIILYSHCVGAALATETVRLLEQEKVPIEGFYSGAILPPRVAGLFGRAFNPWRPFSDKRVLSILRRIGLPDLQADPGFTRFAMRVFRRDVEDFYRYFHDCIRQNLPPITTPVRILVGQQDPMTRRSAARRHFWTRYAASYSLTELADAGHYFIHTHPDRVATLLLGAAHIRPAPAAGAAVRPAARRTANGGS
jgi:amino acid adenylation domain-containing protein